MTFAQADKAAIATAVIDLDFLVGSPADSIVWTEYHTAAVGWYLRVYDRPDSSPKDRRDGRASFQFRLDFGFGFHAITNSCTSA